MRRPHRRLHVLIWILAAPIVAAGLFLALENSPAAPLADIDEAVATSGAD